MKPCDIPLRALIAKDVDGLMMAGRCIGGDFYAQASYCVTGNAVAMDEAAGIVAAIVAKSKRPAPRSRLGRRRGAAGEDEAASLMRVPQWPTIVSRIDGIGMKGIFA